MGRRRLPEFASARELARFLDDPNLGLSKTGYRRLAPLRPVTMRLDDDLVHALKGIATQRRTSYQTLARMWLRERLMDELRPKAQPVPRSVRDRTYVERLLSDLNACVNEVQTLLRTKR